MTALVSATNELIEDNMTDQEVWSLVSELIGEKIAEFEDENVLVSSSKFTALLADTNVNVTNMATGEEFKDISYDDLIDIIRSVRRCPIILDIPNLSRQRQIFLILNRFKPPSKPKIYLSIQQKKPMSI